MKRRIMKVSFLCTEYPVTTHSFIRTEIRSVERSGIVVERIQIRWPTEALPTPEDQDELAKTFSVLDRGMMRLLIDALE